MRFILDVNTKSSKATAEEIKEALEIIERDDFLAGRVTTITLIDDTTSNQFYSEDEFEVKGEMIRQFSLMNILSKKQIANFEKELSEGKSAYEIAEIKSIIKLQEERAEANEKNSIAKAEFESEKTETINIPSPNVGIMDEDEVEISPKSSLAVDEKHVTVFETDIIDRMIEDIRESDSDTLIDLIKYMYPVTAKYDEEASEVTLTVTDEDLALKDIF